MTGEGVDVAPWKRLPLLIGLALGVMLFLE
jgi:hypothetical protein